MITSVLSTKSLDFNLDSETVSGCSMADCYDDPVAHDAFEIATDAGITLYAHVALCQKHLAALKEAKRARKFEAMKLREVKVAG